MLAYKPGGAPAAEAPFRTLRKHEWATSGVRVSRRVDHRLAGQMTLFSSLNVESARLARHGNGAAATLVARLAADLESGPEFAELRNIMSDLPEGDAQRVVEGVLPQDAPPALTQVLKAVARRTEQLRTSDLVFSALAEVIAGRVSEVHEGYVLLVRVSGPTTIVPRWMAGAAQRDKVGALLALVADKLDEVSAVVEAVPAIDVGEIQVSDRFSPFGRIDARARSITASDERLLAGEPQPLQILVPVLIEA